MFDEPDIIELDRHACLPPGAIAILRFKRLEQWPVLVDITAAGRLPIGGDRPLPIDLITSARIQGKEI